MGSSAENQDIRQEVRVDCARWLLPVGSAPVEDGALASRGGVVLAAGRRQDVLSEFGGAAHEIYDHVGAAILPGLVNCHTHLELHPLAGKVRGEGFCGWLAALIEQKAACTTEALREGVRRGLSEAHGFGTALVADNVSPQVPEGGLYEGSLYPAGQALALVELLGFAEAQAEARWAQAAAAAALLEAGGTQASIAPHSPYTVSAALLRKCAGTGGLISVHLAESPDEVEFLRSGHSAIRDLLASRGAWDNAFRPPGVSPVAYLDRLGLLGPATLAVHLVQATGADIALLARRGVAACLCPRSNRATGVGAAPLSALLAANLTVCLGTDSLASNDDLNLFREAEAAIGLGASPEQALRMATLSGAEALSRPELGALSPGRRPQPLLVPIEATVDPVAAVIEAGAQGKVKFLFEFLGMTTTARRPRRPD